MRYTMRPPLQHIFEEAQRRGTQVAAAERAFCQRFGENLDVATKRLAPRKQFPRSPAQMRSILFEAKKQEVMLLMPLAETFASYSAHLKVVDASLAEDVVAGTSTFHPALLQKLGEHMRLLMPEDPASHIQGNIQFADTEQGPRASMADPLSERIADVNELLKQLRDK